MKLLHVPILFLVIFKFLPTEAARILGVLAYHGKSHFVMSEQILKALAKRGHQVDVISHFPQQKPFPNYTDIISLEGTTEIQLVNNMTFEFVTERIGLSMTYIIGHSLGNSLCNLLGLPEMQKFIKNPPRDPPYDLVITQVLGAHCYMAFGHLLNVPVVGVSTCVLYPWMNDPFGNPDNTAFIPNAVTGFTGSMTFWERLQNTVATLYHKIKFNSLTSVQDDLVKQYFGQDTPGVRELERSVTLVLTNSHYSLNGVRPYVPGVVEVGGLHIQDETSEELSQGLKEWMDESDRGFIYFSLGSMLKIESMSRELLQTFYNSLGDIAPVRVLMKIAKPDELLPGLPQNILTLPWIPQIKVLQHKNIRLFMSHGGLMGTQEAIYYGVPLIGFPILGDQHLNMNTYVKKRIAISLDLEKLNKETLDAALNTVLNDPEYRKNAKKVSTQFLDRPLSAMDTAMFWIEYVIRNGPNALRSPVLDLTSWQEALLDVYGALLLAALLAAYLLKIAIGTLMAAFYTSDNKQVLNSRKKNT